MKKTLPSSAGTSRYYYDGQMPVEDDTVASGNTTVTRNLCGAQGIDAISQTTTSGTTWAFPVYDGHGNMVATLARGSGTTFTIGNRRDYDVWGSVRSGSSTGSPNYRHCANLGHVADDESGLVYMRARYYEPTSSRFLSKDPAMHGTNWYVYATCNSVKNVDRTGKVSLGELLGGAAEEAAEKLREAQQGAATLSWAESTIARAMTAWVKQAATELVEQAFGAEFAVSLRAGGIMLTAMADKIMGIAGRINIGIVVENGNIIIKTYGLDGHIMENIIIPLVENL